MSDNNEKTSGRKDTVTELPMVALRGLTLSTGSRIKMTVGRRRTLAAFEAVHEGSYPELVAFLQKDDQVSNPGRDDVYPTGILCKLTEYAPLPEGAPRHSATIMGYKRVRLISLKDAPSGEYRLATAEILEEPQCDEIQLKKTRDVLRSSLDYARKNGTEGNRNVLSSLLPEKTLNELFENESLSRITDMLAQIIELDQSTKLMLLQNLNPLERAQILISALNGFSYRQELERHVLDEAKKAMEQNQREYFLNEQIKAIRRELGMDENTDSEIQEYRQKNRALKAPEYVHERIEREIRKLSGSGSGNSENTVVRNYLDTLLTIPWEAGSEISTDLKHAQEVLNKDHYGLDKVKDRILEYLAVQQKSGGLHGPIICLMGPPGIGKTSLGESIARATGRKFVRVSLGGLHDEAEIRGHRRTYIGALPGRIISGLIKCGVNNPLFLLDEIDKTSDSYHGDPSAALLEVLDPEQNKTFTDNYVDLEYDLSKVMFVTTANSYNIAEPLLDRMEVIDLSSYTEDEKMHIAKEHLVPKQLRLANLKKDELELPDETLLELIRYYTHEAGVRGLERLINEICRKCIKESLLSEKGRRRRRMEKRIVTPADLGRMLGPRRYDFTSKLRENKVGLVNGLAWTSLGGDILQLEVAANEGKGKHILTGKLGEVMKESITAAITLVRSLGGRLHLDPAFYEKCDLHVHVPEGATPKEGPSAGVGMVTGIVSALTGNPVRADVAMTGEITLRGDVLPIGGLKEKLLAALRGGIKLALIPKENEKDLWDVPEKVKTGMKIVPAGRIEDVLKNALENDPFSFAPITPWKAKAKKKTAAHEAKKHESAADQPQ